ncbi:MAG: TadE/TadG family type IV pilus assembly protein [Bacillota bacterium]
MKNLFRNQKGQAVVELAIVLPILIFLFMAILEGGRIFTGYIELQTAARDGARYASIRCNENDVPDSHIQFWKDEHLVPWVQSRLSTVKAGDTAVGLSRHKNVDGTEVWVEVTVTYPLEVKTPVIGTILGNPFYLSVAMSMRTE